MSSVHAQVSSSPDAQSSFEHEPCGGWMLRRTEEEQWSDTERVRLCYQRAHGAGEHRRNWLSAWLFPLLDFGVRSFNSEDAGDQNETSDLPQLAHSLLQFQWVDLSSPALAHIHTLWCDCCSMSLYTDVSSVSWWLMGRTFYHLINKCCC